MNKTIELLAPAGDFEKMMYAIHYGADAVYLSGKQFGLRAHAGNFSLNEMEEAVEYAHRRQVKVYVTVNMYPRNEDLEGLEEYLHQLEALSVDALIVADPGVYSCIRKEKIKIPIHISTQATIVNWAAVRFWQDQGGVERVVLSRELSLEEIKTIRQQVPEMPLEGFVHGAMCMSYSGRCLLSNYLADRDANRGACAQPCRWKYALVEEKRPGQFFPIEEDQTGSYIFNSHDLCLIKQIPDLIESGLSSLKIEGRMKSLYYVSVVVRAYRAVIDAYIQQKSIDLDYWFVELEKISHRPYTTGFYYGRPEDHALSVKTGGYIQNHEFCGIVLAYDEKTQIATIEERNKICVGDEIEFLRKDGKRNQKLIIEKLNNSKNENVDCVSKAQEIFTIKLPFAVESMDIMRKIY